MATLLLAQTKYCTLMLARVNLKKLGPQIGYLEKRLRND
jgi:hypothetical protein